MKNKFRNIFLGLGIVAVGIMIATFDMDYSELWISIQRAGYYFPLILLLWVFVYLLNAIAWYLIIGDGRRGSVPFGQIYKFTISGFALNYVTPVGLMGGEPYRIMELKPYIGMERATSSVILYVMMHIFSHFIFWLVSVALYIFFYPVNGLIAAILAMITLFCLICAMIFIRGYRNGMAVVFVEICSRIPLLNKYATRLAEKHGEKLERIDAQIALLHQKRKRTFYFALSIEFIARVLACLEIWLILNVLTSDVNFIDCMLIIALASLIGNLLFFIPMQLGGREGGFALAVTGLSMSGAYGVYTALLTRVREIVWIVIGLILIRIGNNESDD